MPKDMATKTMETAGVTGRYSTIQDVAAELKISYSKARDLVLLEPGILNLSKNRKRMIRIPREVFDRIIQRYSA